MALNETGKVRVTWSRPTLGPGQRITGYSVEYRRSGTTSYITHSVSGSYTTSYTITNLNLGTVYEVRVASVGPLGLSGYCCGSGKQVTTYNSECRVFARECFLYIVCLSAIGCWCCVCNCLPLGCDPSCPCMKRIYCISLSQYAELRQVPAGCMWSGVSNRQLSGFCTERVVHQTIKSLCPPHHNCLTISQHCSQILGTML